MIYKLHIAISVNEKRYCIYNHTKWRFRKERMGKRVQNEVDTHKE